MRLFLYANFFSPDGGVESRSVTRVATGLIARGHHVTVIYAYGSPRPRDIGAEYITPNIRFRSLEPARSRILGAQWAQRAIDRGAFDTGISFSTFVRGPIMMPLCSLLSQRVRALRRACPSALARWRYDREYIWPAALEAMWRERRCLNHPRMQRFLAVSELAASDVRQHGLVPEARVRTVRLRPAFPPPTQSARGDDRRRICRAFNVEERQVMLLFHTGDPLQEGAGQLVEALAQLPEAVRRHIVLLMTGKVAYAQIRQAARLGVRDMLRFIQPTSHVARLISLVDAMIVPAWFDTWGEQVLHALSHGTPVITTRCCAGADAVISGAGPHPGIVIDQPGNIDALAYAIEQVADDDARRLMTGAAEGLPSPPDDEADINAIEGHLKDTARRNATVSHGRAFIG